MIIVTGGAGFIGSNFILKWLENSKENILNIDNLSYAANLRNLKVIESDPRYSCLLYTSPSPRDHHLSRMPSSA